MLLVEIGTATAISAYFYMHITSDPIERQPVQLSDYLFVFGCGLVFWLLVLLRAKLHGSGDRQADIRKVAKLAKLIAPITTLSLCGCLLAPFMKLPLLVRFLVLFQVSSNLALLLIWAFLSLKELRDAHTQQQQQESLFQLLRQKFLLLESGGAEAKRSPKPQAVQQQRPLHIGKKTKLDIQRFLAEGRGGKVDKAGGSGSGHGSGASGSGGGSEGGDSGSVSDGGGDRGASGSGHGSGAGGSGENRVRDDDHGQDEGRSDSEHDSGAVGSWDNGGRDDGDRQHGGGTGSEHGNRAGGSGENRGNSSYSITEMSLMLTAQATSTLIGFHAIPTPSSSSKTFLVVTLMDQLVAYLCGLTSIMLKSSNKPDPAEIFEKIGLFCTALGFILMVAMFVAWYLVLIAVLLFGVVWFFFFGNDLKTNLEKCIANLEKFIEMQSESGS